MSKQKAYAAFIVLVVGLFALLEGSRFIYGIAIDATLVVVGAVLTLAYFFLIGDYLQRRLRATQTITLMPVLLVLGAVTIYQAVIRTIDIVSRSLFGVLGIILILVPAFMLYRAAKKGL